MKTILPLFLLLFISQVSFGQTDSLTKIKIIKDIESLSLSNASDTANYAIGIIFAKQLESLPEIITIDDVMMLKGLVAAQQHKASFTFEEAQKMLMEIVSPPQEEEAVAVVEDAAEAVEAVEAVEVEETKPIRPKAKMSPEEMVFFVKNGKRKGVKTTSSGIQYELILGSGRGASPTLEDKINFFCFAKYPKDGLIVNVEKGAYANIQYQDAKWQEIYQLLKVGNTYRFYLPSVYSNRAPDTFANEGEMIIVDIELKNIQEPYRYDEEEGY